MRFARLTEVAPADLVALFNDPLVRRHMPLASGEFRLDDCAGWVAAKDATWAEHGYGPQAIFVDDAFAGWGGLQPEDGDTDLAVVLHPRYWGHGRAVVELLLDQAFGELGFASVTILLPASRAAAHGVRRLGFLPDGSATFGDVAFQRFRLTAADRRAA
ncbi:MAG: GNAT family N-acetyltransferase [Hamadaea sp.]|nr:GNAT family N-acetyltransferase [Hamadaea sp.]